MVDLIDKVALALYEFENRQAKKEFPDCAAVDSEGWSVLLSEQGKKYWRDLALVAIKAIGS